MMTLFRYHLCNKQVINIKACHGCVAFHELHYFICHLLFISEVISLVKSKIKLCNNVKTINMVQSKTQGTNNQPDYPMVQNEPTKKKWYSFYNIYTYSPNLNQSGSLGFLTAKLYLKKEN